MSNLTTDTDQAVVHFVNPMRGAFSVPSDIPQDDFLVALIASLAEFSPHQLKEAAKWFRDHRDKRTFPTIAECRQACERFRVQPSGSRAKERGKQDRREQAERHRFACHLCRCEMGEQADREGWLVALIEFVAERGRLPMGLEINHVRSIAHRSERGLESNRGSPLYASLCNWRKIMLERAHREVFGDWDALRREDRLEEAAE